MPLFISKELSRRINKLVDLLEDNIDEDQISELKAAALKRRVEFLINELEIIENQKQSIQSELVELQKQLEVLKDEEEGRIV